MNIRRLLLCGAVGVFMLTGCGKKADASVYTQAILDTLCRADYTDYADLMDISTTQVSGYHTAFIENEKEAFLKLTGSGRPSDEMDARITDFLTMLYAVADYSVSEESTDGSVDVTIRPITLITDQYDAIRKACKSFNKNNDNYEYAEVEASDYYDTYLESVLTPLESSLSDVPYGESVTITLTPTEEDGLMTLSNEDLTELTKTLLPMTAPEK